MPPYQPDEVLGRFKIHENDLEELRKGELKKLPQTFYIVSWKNFRPEEKPTEQTGGDYRNYVIGIYEQIIRTDGRGFKQETDPDGNVVYGAALGNITVQDQVTVEGLTGEACNEIELGPMIRLNRGTWFTFKGNPPDLRETFGSPTSTFIDLTTADWSSTTTPKNILGVDTIVNLNTKGDAYTFIAWVATDDATDDANAVENWVRETVARNSLDPEKLKVVVDQEKLTPSPDTLPNLVCTITNNNSITLAGMDYTNKSYVALVLLLYYTPPHSGGSKNRINKTASKRVKTKPWVYRILLHKGEGCTVYPEPDDEFGAVQITKNERTEHFPYGFQTIVNVADGLKTIGPNGQLPTKTEARLEFPDETNTYKMETLTCSMVQRPVVPAPVVPAPVVPAPVVPAVAPAPVVPAPVVPAPVVPVDVVSKKRKREEVVEPTTAPVVPVDVSKKRKREEVEEAKTEKMLYFNLPERGRSYEYTYYNTSKKKEITKKDVWWALEKDRGSPKKYNMVSHIFDVLNDVDVKRITTKNGFQYEIGLETLKNHFVVNLPLASQTQISEKQSMTTVYGYFFTSRNQSLQYMNRLEASKIFHFETTEERANRFK